jgi:hypothetical protein
MPHEFIDHAQECLRWADNTADPERKAIFHTDGQHAGDGGVAR